MVKNLTGGTQLSKLSSIPGKDSFGFMSHFEPTQLAVLINEKPVRKHFQNTLIKICSCRQNVAKSTWTTLKYVVLDKKSTVLPFLPKSEHETLLVLCFICPLPIQITCQESWLV